jgi:hypothetical protein
MVDKILHTQNEIERNPLKFRDSGREIITCSTRGTPVKNPVIIFMEEECRTGL